MGGRVLGRLTALTRLCVGAEGPGLAEVGWVAPDGSGPRLRVLELDFCSLEEGSTSPEAVEQLETLRLLAARGAKGLVEALPLARSLSRLSLESPPEMEGSEMEGSVMEVSVGRPS